MTCGSGAVVRLLCSAVLLWSVAGIACAEGQPGSGSYFFQWTDDRGTVHVTDRVENVPSRYRSRTTVMPQPSAPGGQEPSAPGGQEPSAPPASVQRPDVQRDAAEAEADLKEAWQYRVRDARRRLGIAEQKIRALEERKQAITALFGASGATLPTQESLDQIKQIERQMEQVKQEISELRNEISTVIPDEARKAGIPPGWLREAE